MFHVKKFESYNSSIENISENNIYISDTDQYGKIISDEDGIVKYAIVSDSDGEQYDKNVYTYIKSHFDELISNDRIKYI